MPNPDIYIAHSSADQGSAEKLANTLIANELKVWIDSFQIDSNSSSQERDVLKENAILKCRLFVLVLSPDGLDEDQKDVLYIARSANKKILVLQLTDCRIPVKLKRYPALVLDASMRNGLKTIRALLEQGVVPNPVAAEPVFNPGPKVEASASAIPMSPSEKRALLPAVEDLDNALKIVNNRVHYAIFEIAIHAIIVVALIVAIMTYGIGGAKNQLDTAMGFLENFYPGIGTILPGVIGLSAFKKYRLREDKRRQLLKLYDKRRRLLSDIKDRSLESIKSVETELSAILNM